MTDERGAKDLARAGDGGRLEPADAQGGRFGLRRALLERVTRGVDGFYLAFQSMLKVYGLVGTGAGATPPESVDAQGRRFAVLPGRPGRWPEWMVPLPDEVLYWYPVESIFRRAELWRAFGTLEELRGFYRDQLAARWPAVEEKDAGGGVRFSLAGGGVESLVKLVPLPDGPIVLSIGQKIGRLRLEEAERALEPARPGPRLLNEPDPRTP